MVSNAAITDLQNEFEATAYHPVESELGSVIDIESFSLWYSEKQALFNNTLKIQKELVTALIGPSGCGKSTLLRSFNRMNDLIDGIRHDGTISIDGSEIHDPRIEVIELRKRLGMVFQKPNPFPMSIYENVVYPLRVDGIRDKSLLEETCERTLRDAALWDEVSDRLQDNALGLSGGQQQRLCIARAIASEPEIILMDEPCSALDPIATARIEDLIAQLKEHFSIVIVTHNMQQAARVSDNTAFMFLGRLIEYGETKKIFMNPMHVRTSDYITGRFG